ncbi:MAG: hypothetical protein ACKOS8_07135 [Gemmataceae bacterium]
MNLLLLLLACQPAPGDLTLTSSVDLTSLLPGASVTITAHLHSRLALNAGAWPPVRWAAPPDPDLWTMEDPTVVVGPKVATTTWRLTALKPGLWQPPDLACAYQRADIPFTAAAQTLRLAALPPIEVREPAEQSSNELTRILAQGDPPPLPTLVRVGITLTRLAWVGPPVFCLIWAISAWLNWPRDPDACKARWRRWLEKNGLPPGRHTTEGISNHLLAKGWTQAKIEKILASWNHPMEAPPLPHPNRSSLLAMLLAGVLGTVTGAMYSTTWVPFVSAQAKAELAKADQLWREGDVMAARKIYFWGFMKRQPEAFQRLAMAGEIDWKRYPLQPFLLSLTWLSVWVIIGILCRAWLILVGLLIAPLLFLA